ncbi:MAG: hypothetical protein Kow00108_15110 [Calditrichia bacterium]
MDNSNNRIKNFSCSTKIRQGNYNFTIHTGNLKEKTLILSEIFREGQYITKRELPYDVRLDSKQKIQYDYLSEMTRQFHLTIADRLEALFSISAKLEKKGTVQAHYQLGVIFLNLSFLDEAEKHFKLAIQSQTDYIRAHFGLAIIKLRKKLYKDALLILRNCMDITSSFADFHNLNGVIHLFMEDYARAIESFKKAIEINPNYIESQLNLGLAIYYNALLGVENEKSIGIPARVSIYLKQLMTQKKYQSIAWQKRFKEILELIKSSNHQLLQTEMKKFLLEITNLSSEKDRIFEFFLRFIYGGREITLDTLEEYEAEFKLLLKEYGNYPDLWNDLSIFRLVKSRVFLLKALHAFKQASNSPIEGNEGIQNYELIRTKEKGFLLLLRALLKNSSM